MTALFAATLFLSAGLLFWVQPMIAKMLLPLLGGAPSVWNTCMVFFQAMLLGGYAYAHFVSRRLQFTAQIAVHIALLALATLMLPFRIPETLVGSLTGEANPALWLLGALVAVVGFPFFVVAASGPLLQRWFSRTRHGEAGDPYFLYSASNFGSLLSLLSYPVLLEPQLRLKEQARIWAVGFVALGLGILSCGLAAWRARQRPAGVAADAMSEPGQGSLGAAGRASRPGGQGLRWMAFGFVPSSLMLGVTTYLGTDIASIPLLWIVPLSLYLVSFVVVFARRQLVPLSWVRWLLPVAALGTLFQILTRAAHPVWLVIVTHLVFLFLAAMVCHARLAAERPAVEGLTGFYFWMAAGGVLGGIFNAVLAPVLFRTVVEYPLVIVLACLLRTGGTVEIPARRRLDLALPGLLAVFTAALSLLIPFAELNSENLRNGLIIGLPTILCFTFVDRPLRFGLGLAGILVGGWSYHVPRGKTLHVERNFFGVSRVTLSQDGRFRYFIHGNTLHGGQFVEAARRCEPLTYYHRSGPLGDIFVRYQTGASAGPVAVIGLGAGTTACYARPGEDWTFYEIDPAVIRLARNTNYFSYLGVCAQTELRIRIGDARLQLQDAPAHYYGLMVFDAFSSDAIPAHLLTREALAMYLTKLAPGGLLAFHISNRYLDLEPVLADLAADAKLVSRQRDDWNVSAEETADGKEESHWVILARREADLGALVKKSQWWRLEGRSPPEVWTDDFSNLIRVFKWR
jgi:SAM-dependent methyltransferase